MVKNEPISKLNEKYVEIYFLLIPTKKKVKLD